MKTTLNWKKTDLEDHTRPELTQPFPEISQNIRCVRPPQSAQSTKFSCRHIFCLPGTIAKMVIEVLNDILDVNGEGTERGVYNDAFISIVCFPIIN